MKMNETQQQAIDSEAKVILVTAGPGSGKTRTFVQRIWRMVNEGIDPKTIYAITFTNAAAKEMQERLFKLSSAIKLGYIGTLHGWMLRVIQRHPQAAGLAGRVTVLDEPAVDEMVESVIKLLNFTGPVKAVNSAIGKGIGHYREFNPAKCSPVDRVAYEFYHRMMTNGCLSFDAVLELGLQVLRSGVDTGCRHLMVDEFQDSCPIDFQIYQSLRPVPTMFMVGDPDQAIYSFRGGDQSLILRLAERPDVRLFKLETNYRSTEAVCQAANRLISYNQNRMLKECKPFKLQPGAVEKNVFKNEGTERHYICGQIATLTVNGVAPAEIAVLVRTNALAVEIASALKGCGIEVSSRKTVSRPPDWPAARTLVTMLTNPDNDFLARRFLEFRLGKERAQELANTARDNFTTLNESVLKIKNVGVPDVINIMVGMRLGVESVSMMREHIERLPEGATLPELQFALTQNEEQAAMGSGVTVATLHAAKGREWDIVFLPAWEDRILPMRRDGCDEEEERRLAFVGVTRAKTRCFISHSLTRTAPWQKDPQPTKPSKFYAEVL